MNSLILISLLFFCACGQQNVEENKNYGLESIDNIALKIDETTPNFSMGLQYFADGDQEWVFNINWNTNSLQMYELPHGNLVKTMVFEKEGDQGIGGLMGFHIHTLDSIFLFTQHGDSFVLVDTAGSIKERFRYEVPKNHTNAFVHNVSYVTPPIIRGKEIFFKTRPAVVSNYLEMTDELLSTSSLGFKLDMGSLELDLLPHRYPKGYLENGLRRFENSRAQGKSKVVYSFFGDHNLYWADDFDTPLKAVDGRSEFLNERLPLLPKEGVPIESQKYSFASSRYDNLIYDPFKDVFYRFAFPDLEVESEEEVRALRSNPGPFVVMVFDGDLNILGETYFEGGKYLPMNAFVGQKGLYLSTNNPDNSDNQEDLMGFEVFSFASFLEAF
ncbi:DUF4221 domain-containing protein [Belliella sp. R4-6]|uniref:DUF4221 domain-containing protein n=1 Tax=Belliella alkalica TaxID=1730871 RepID=A0ABS9VFQ7_9BACT|nr:DUF4221 domain-containing protein [Belliella alkalica]